MADTGEAFRDRYRALEGTFDERLAVTPFPERGIDLAFSELQGVISEGQVNGELTMTGGLALLSDLAMRASVAAQENAATTAAQHYRDIGKGLELALKLMERSIEAKPTDTSTKDVSGRKDNPGDQQ